MQQKEVPPTVIAVAIAVVVVVIGFFAYRAAQPPVPTSQSQSAGLSADPNNPAKPPVADAHANDWHPPAPAGK